MSTFWGKFNPFKKNEGAAATVVPVPVENPFEVTCQKFNKFYAMPLLPNGRVRPTFPIFSPPNVPGVNYSFVAYHTIIWVEVNINDNEANDNEANESEANDNDESKVNDDNDNDKRLKNIISSTSSFYNPVLPNPPAPLSVSTNSSTSCNSFVNILSKINCAILSPVFIVKSYAPWLNRITFISPV